MAARRRAERRRRTRVAPARRGTRDAVGTPRSRTSRTLYVHVRQHLDWRSGGWRRFVELRSRNVYSAECGERSSGSERHAGGCVEHERPVVHFLLQINRKQDLNNELPNRLKLRYNRTTEKQLIDKLNYEQKANGNQQRSTFICFSLFIAEDDLKMLTTKKITFLWITKLHLYSFLV